MDARPLIKELVRRAPTHDEIVALLKGATKDPSVLEDLCAAARAVRDAEAPAPEEEAAFNSVVPCYLKPLCNYCPYWRGSKSAPMSVENVLQFVKRLKDTSSVRQFHLSGGSRRDGVDCGIASIVRAIREAGYDDMRIVVNCGACFSDEELAELKSLGVLRVFSVFETLNPDVFAAAKPGDDLAEKLDFARRIAEAGMQVGTGLMAGLGPAETRFEDYADALCRLSKMDGLGCLYVSKFRHAANIPMNDHPECSVEEATALVALARLTLRNIHIRCAAGWGKDDCKWVQKSGAGSITIPLSFSCSQAAW